MRPAASPFAPLLDQLSFCHVESEAGHTLAFADLSAAADRAVRTAFGDAVITGQRVLVYAEAALLSRIVGLWQAGAVPVVDPPASRAQNPADAQWDWREHGRIRLAKNAPTVREAGEDRLAIIHLSSGSTGAPKPAPRSMASLLAEAHRYISRYGLGPGHRTLVAAPICHSFGFGAFLGAAVAGGPVSLPVTFHARRLARRLRAGEFDVVVLTVPMARLLVAAVGSDSRPGTAGPRLAIAGAGPVPDGLAAAFERAFGCPLGRNYGCSETGATFGAATTLDQGTIGRPFDGVEILAPSVPGETAELVLDLGHAVLAATSPAGPSRIWHTGDRATRLPDGSIRLHGRLDDRLEIDGKTVRAAEIVAAALAAPGVRDAAALTATAPWAADRDLLVVACEGAGIDVKRFREAVIATGAPPPLVLIFTILPRTAAGKPDRAAIVAALAEWRGTTDADSAMAAEDAPA
jgi:acyl-CoA synthetase (AMP-forming)/AMP-acid ligase II